MLGQSDIYRVLEELNIKYEYHEHPPLDTIEEAIKHKSWMDAMFCKNIFLRNHKGNRHYLAVFDHKHNLMISDLEQKLKQGKLSFASEKRMQKYLGLKPGSVSPFGIINDDQRHVYMFLDNNILKAERVSFHPNDSRATLIISSGDFMKFIEWSGAGYEFLSLY
ncbi:MAG: prolyl-tRNA synthetase associated domain-containing protein [Bacteroidales bacterium]|jgi:Ala-tRNA(Pro) deacylase|nr:prolyl-tRNA synthetase associated domain-containing protein [Bacteroidales bacterium]